MNAEDDPECEGLASHRLAVADVTGAPLATVTLRAGDAGRVNLNIQGREEANALGPFIETLRERRAGSDKDVEPRARVAAAAALFTEVLKDGGYSVTDLPSGDVEVTAVLDLRTGRAVAAQTPLHPFAAGSPDLSQVVASAMREMPAKFSRDVLARISAALDSGDHQAAAAALEQAREEGLLAFADATVLDAALRIQVHEFASTDEKATRMVRVALAAKLCSAERAEPDARVLLNRDDLAPDERANLEVSLGVVLRKRGAVQAAISLWRKVATNGGLPAGVRAWAWRNLSLALSPSGTEAVRAARASADAFLEDGEKREAVTSLLGLCDILEHHDLRQAAAELESLLELVNAQGLWGRFERAALHHALGNRFEGVRQHARALAEAEEAIALRRALQGAEDELISSLHLAAMAARSLGEVGKADAYRLEAEELTRDCGSEHFRLGARIAAMLSAFDPAAAAKLVADARASGEPDLWSSAELAVALRDPTLEPAFRLARFEDLHEELLHARVRFVTRMPVALAIATALADAGDLAASAAWLADMLKEDAGALDVRDRLAETLRQDERWGDLAVFLKSQIALHGEQPGLLTWYGRALLESGDASGAVTQLTVALRLMPDEAPARRFAKDLRERALELGGTILPPTAEPSDAPVLRVDLERAFRDYQGFISGQKRMTFWRSGPIDHEWTDQPERQAQDLLHTFLKARFDERIDVFEELGAGAGRMDLLLRFEGGLQAIVELKLCGYGYTGSYAASGEDQIRHYMEARNVHLGYLIVHDARLTDAGRPLLTPTSGPNTVFEYLINISPRMPEKRGRRRNS